jgi:hypothetical protein
MINVKKEGVKCVEDKRTPFFDEIRNGSIL